MIGAFNTGSWVASRSILFPTAISSLPPDFFEKRKKLKEEIAALKISTAHIKIIEVTRRPTLAGEDMTKMSLDKLDKYMHNRISLNGHK